MISGWAVEPNAIYRYQVDAAFPLSDHAITTISGVMSIW
jgi:DNA ligase-1